MESLSELLAKELSELGRFCALLDEERNVLTGAQADRLPDIAAEKSLIAGRLNQMEMQREALLAAAGFPQGRSGIEAWLASRPDEDGQRGRWNDVLKLARTARNGNETNGRLINLLLSRNQEALSMLLSGGTESIYGVDGQQRGLVSGKRSFGAV